MNNIYILIETCIFYNYYNTANNEFFIPNPITHFIYCYVSPFMVYTTN